jgi:CRISPR type I-E-associated protein CasB/Cse2
MQATTKSKKQVHLENSTEFLIEIQKIIEKNPKAKAILRNALSLDPHHIQSTYWIVLPRLGKVDRWDQRFYILVAGLLAQYPQKIQADMEQRKNFGGSYRQLLNITGTGSTEQRFKTLISTDLVDMPLVSAIRHMKAKDVSVDYIQLLTDILQWDHYDRFIQDAWARSFWGKSPEIEPIETTTELINHAN